jgi:hypothetical protein
MTPDSFQMFIQLIYETISSLPDPSDFDRPLSATEIRKVQEGLRSVEHRIRKLGDELDEELETTKSARMN